MEIWKLEKWMGPHFAVNMPVVQKALGKEVEERYLTIARMAEEMAPPDYPFFRLKAEDVMTALKRMRIEAN